MKFNNLHGTLGIILLLLHKHQRHHFPVTPKDVNDKSTVEAVGVLLQNECKINSKMMFQCKDKESYPKKRLY